MTRRLALLALALGLSAGGCSPRDRSNPLDPLNRATGGNLTGFHALAGDAAVVLRWTLLTQEGVIGYRIDRWLPGETPRPLPGASFEAHVSAAEDLSVQNDSTYLYRLVARFASGDSAVSPPDTVTPGTRRAIVLVAELPGYLALAPDVRDILYANVAEEPFDDLEVDSARGIFWLTQYEQGAIVRRRFEGSSVGVPLHADRPADLAVTTARGIGWVTQPDQQRVLKFGFPDTNATEPGTPIVGVGPARIVETNSETGNVWVGADDGGLYFADAGTSDTLYSWRLPARVVAIAVSGRTSAYAAIRAGSLCDLYAVVVGDRAPRLVRAGLLNVTDLAYDPSSDGLWVSERGAPLTGNGRLSLLNGVGATVASVMGIEPYALELEKGSSNCWVTDIASDRLLEVTPSGIIVRRSLRLGIPYAIRIYRP